MKKIILTFQFLILLLLLIKSPSLFAQSDSIPKISANAQIDLVSHYIWRGLDNGQTPGVQPGLTVTWKDFTVGYWGAYRLGGSGDHETDFYVEKAIGSLTFSIWDYWSHSDSISNNYFDYNKNTTSHLLEAQILFSGGEKLPFNLLGSYFFYGADPTKSMYFELQYLHSFGSIDTQTFAGFQAKGDFYAPEAAFVNLGCTASKSFKITENWSIPFNLSFIVNPDSKKVFLVAGITLLTL